MRLNCYVLSIVERRRGADGNRIERVQAFTGEQWREAVAVGERIWADEHQDLHRITLYHIGEGDIVQNWGDRRS